MRPPPPTVPLATGPAPPRRPDRRPPAPRVGVVVVHYGDGELTLRCLESVLRTDWPPNALEVVVVDNGPPGSRVPERAGRLPGVRVVGDGHNQGFAGGCNLGIDELGTGVDYVALLNNDATADQGWLAPLVAALEAEPALGAACPKIVFDGAFVEVALRSEMAGRGFGDRRPLGVRLHDVEVDGRAGTGAWRRVQLASGFWGLEHDPGGGGSFHWTDGDARLRVRVGDDGTHPRVALRLSSPDGERAVTLSSGSERSAVKAGPEPRWYEVAVGGEPESVIASVGTALVDGAVVDRGYLEADGGRYPEAEEVFGWCGAAVVLSRRYLEAVGPFEHRYFLYYEDADLSWRGRAQGWRYRYVPGPPVRHLHSASVGEGSRLHHHYNERNCLLTFLRNAPAGAAARCVLRHVLVTGSYARRDVVHPLVHGRRPSWERVSRHSGALASFVAALPWALPSRRRLRARQVVDDAELGAWLTAPSRPRPGHRHR